MAYCRICGAQLEENAHFCHKCGTPVVTLTLAPVPQPLAVSTHKKGVSPEVVAIVAVVVVVVIVGIFVFAFFYSEQVNQSNNNANQGNTMSLSFNVPTAIPKANVLAQNLTGKTSLHSICARAPI